MKKRKFLFRNFAYAKYLLFIVALACQWIVSCQRESSGNESTELLVAEVVSLAETQEQLVGEVPRLIFGPREFPALSDLSTLSSPSLKLMQGGEINAVPFGKSLILDGLFSGGEPPLLEHRKVNGIVRPLSTHSLMMLSALYQFDSLVSQFEALTGEKAEAFFSATSPLSIYFHPSVLVKESRGSLRQFESNNAAYIAGARQFALFKTSVEEKIPLIVNPQILSHEFGHAIFEFFFFGNKFERCDAASENDARLFKGRLELEFALRGINEGFSDFFSFVWSGSSNVLEASVGAVQESSERNFSLIDFNYESLAAQQLGCFGSYYCIGSLWAKVLLETYRGEGFDSSHPAQRREYFKELVVAMKQVGESLRAEGGSALPEPDAATRACEVREVPFSSVDDELLGAFFQAHIETMSPARRKIYCEKLDTAFGRSGFPVRYRGGCS